MTDKTYEYGSLWRYTPVFIVFLCIFLSSIAHEIILQPLPQTKYDTKGAAKPVFTVQESEPVIASVMDGKSVVTMKQDSARSGIVLTRFHDQTGEKLWENNVQGYATAEPLVVNGKIYCATNELAVAFDSSSGETVWSSDKFDYQSVVGDDIPDKQYVSGFLYHKKTDSLVVQVSTGVLFTLNRTTGAPSSRMVGLPCIGTSFGQRDSIRASLLQFFLPETFMSAWFPYDIPSVFDFGHDAKQCAITSPLLYQDTIIVPGLAPDITDKTNDNSTEIGAIYGLKLARNAKNLIDMQAVGYAIIAGGPTAKMTIDTHNSILVVVDNVGNLQGFSTDNFKQKWNVNTNVRILGSPVYVPARDEIIVSTPDSVMSIVNPQSQKFHAFEPSWVSQLNEELFDESHNFASSIILTQPSMYPNGKSLIVSVGLGYKQYLHRIGYISIVLRSNILVLGVDDGKLERVLLGEEYKSLSTSFDGDSMYCTNFPLNREIWAYFWGNRMDDRKWGVSKYMLK